MDGGGGYQIGDIFGKPLTELSLGEKGRLHERVASLVRGSLLHSFQTAAGAEALIDSFSFYSDEKSGEESIAIGKYLTDDLLFSYRQGFKENKAGEVRVEYKLKGGCSIESLYSDQEEKSGFDFFWSKDF